MKVVRAHLLALALPVGILFHQLLLGKVLFWGTISLQFVPWREMAFGALRQARLPLWNPLTGNGTPLLANYQTAVFYPPNWLHMFLPAAHATGWIGMLHLVWAGLGMAAYLRRLDVDRFGQRIGALAYALSGYLVSRFAFPSITSAAAWLPWLVWALEGLWDGEGRELRQRIALLGGVVVMQLLAGHAQTTYYSLVLAGGYALWRAIQRRVPRRLPLALGGVVLGVGLAGVQLLPTLELLRTSQRSGGVDPTLALTYSYWPWRGLSWLAPNLFGSPATGDYWGYGNYWEDATFVGVLGLLLAAQALVRRARGARADAPGRHVTPFFALVIPLAVLLALGGNTPVFVWLFEHVPTFDLFQAPARWMLLAVLAVAALAGIGAHGWQVGERGLFWTRLATAGGVSALVVALVGQRFLGSVEPSLVRAAVRLGIMVILIGALILLQPKPEGQRRWLWEGAALALLALDLVAANWGLNPAIDPAFYRRRSPLADDLRASETRTLYLPQDEYAAKFTTFLDTRDFGSETLEAWLPMRESLLPNFGTLDGVPAANNFDPLRVGPHDLLLESTRDLPLEEALPRLRAMNVGTLLTTQTFAGLEPVAVAGPVTAYALPDPLPRSYLVGEAWLARDSDEALALMETEPFDPARVVIVEGAIGGGSGDATTPTGTARITLAEATRVEIEVDANEAGWLVLSDSWYPGWEATLDGEAIQVLRANVAFRAVRVPQGEHTVVFAYRPRSLWWGAALSALALGVAAALAALPDKPQQ